MTVQNDLARPSSRRSAISRDSTTLEDGASLSQMSSSESEGLDDPLDGHRPSLREIRSHTSRTRCRSGHGELGRTMSLATEPSRIDTIMSRIRSRPIPEFTHHLASMPTSANCLVDFDGAEDPYRPLNWPTHKKVLTTLLYGLITMSATWASSSYSAGTDLIAKEFHVSTQVATLGTTLYLFGFGLGPLLWAPLSEVYGRRVPVLTPMFIAVCFTFAAATAKDLQTIMLTRFWGAFFASAPMTNTGGVLGDLFSPAWRGVALAGYSMAIVCGPALGPVISTIVAQQPSLGWRWTEYLTGIIQSVILLIAALAQKLRHDTGNWALHAQFEEWQITFDQLARKFLVRPIQILCTPICFLITLYASFVYGILYMQLGAIPIIFQQVRGWDPIPAALPFLSIIIGAAFGCGLNIYNQFLYNKAYYAAGNKAVPEMRLPPMMLGSFLFCGSQFLIGWTAQPSVTWVAPCIGLAMLGMGFFTIFQAALNYLVDTFQAYAASAIGANTFLRSCVAGALPLAVGPLYHNIGVGPGSSITGGFAALLIPVPFAFYLYGKKLRAASKWSNGSVVI
ncbi:MSF membrane transporter [Dactylonectria estremocensis]|uniref:MSF membrane transporter n=1 Tax=Dactylonectria estremocensis TaxID=1079267 RepID=A0A9P9DM18_9HYPO|nr:MSF membrane transporter [Dactylonectria estremocensis]